MSNFGSCRDYWHFAHCARSRNRHIADNRVQNFIRTVTETCRSRQREIPSGSRLYRAQLGCINRPIIQEDVHVADEAWPYPPERMVPTLENSFEGRANPRGITYLYLANNEDTACAEVRPYKGAFVSVGVFKVKRELKVVDCTKDIKESKSKIIYIEEPDPETREKIVWAQINKAFSKPVNPHEPETEYVPTQIIAEIFRKEGFDGLACKSSLVEKGVNVVLFDVNDAEMISCWLKKTKSIFFNFAHTKSGYNCREKKLVMNTVLGSRDNTS